VPDSSEGVMIFAPCCLPVKIFFSFLPGVWQKQKDDAFFIDRD